MQSFICRDFYIAAPEDGRAPGAWATRRHLVSYENDDGLRAVGLRAGDQGAFSKEANRVFRAFKLFRLSGEFPIPFFLHRDKIKTACLKRRCDLIGYQRWFAPKRL